MSVTRTGYCNVVSAANEIELVFIINRDNKTTTLDTMRIGDNDKVSTASKIELVSLEMLVINTEDDGITARVSNGADIAVITKENNDLMLVTDKFEPMAIADKNDFLLVTDKNIFGVEARKISTALEVYNISRDTLEVTIPNTLEVYNVPQRDNFAGNLDTCAGSFDRLTSDPLLATSGCIHKNFRQFSAM